MKTPLRQILGLRVKEFRHASKLSQEAFADKCGFARSYMSRIERGKANLSLDAIEVIATTLEIDETELIKR